VHLSIDGFKIIRNWLCLFDHTAKQYNTIQMIDFMAKALGQFAERLHHKATKFTEQLPWKGCTKLRGTSAESMVSFFMMEEKGAF